MQGLVFDIKRYAVHDGPGIRTTIFLKGCPLKCWWCHNPESQLFKPEPTIKLNKFDNKVFKQRVTIGKFMTVEEVMSEIEKDAIFYEESGGGVTFSGGEPLMQPDFLYHLLEASKKKGFHTTVDTTGYASKTTIKKIADKVDLFLYDLKLINDSEHQKYVEAPNNIIFENLEFLIEKNKKIILRFPVIPRITDTKENIDKLKKYIIKIKTNNVNEIDLLPYHDIAKGKYNKFKKENKMSDIEESSKERLIELKKEFENLGFFVKIGG